MSPQRFRHKFTLGSVEKSQRPQAVDPFERDPFKIHSFNFRYADRPSFLPLPDWQQRVNSHETLKDCKTYFYNQGFSNMNNLNAVRVPGSQNDQRLINLAKFQEYRKRKVLNQAGSGRTCDLPQINEHFSSFNKDSSKSKTSNSNDTKGIAKTTKNSFEQNNCNAALSYNANINNSLTNNTSAASARTDMQAECSKRPSISPQTYNAPQIRMPSSTAFIANCKSAIGSGCEININIKRPENKSRNENVNIKIGTNSIYKNLNIPLTKTSREEWHAKSGRLSQLSFPEDKPNGMKKTGNDRTKTLSSIYSSQSFIKSPKLRENPVKSIERFSSLIPFKASNYKENKSSCLPKESFTSRKSSFQRVRDSLSVYDNNTVRKGNSHKNLNGSSCQDAKTGYSVTKLSRRLDPNYTASSKIRSNERLPLNININVFAEKLKFL